MLLYLGPCHGASTEGAVPLSQTSSEEAKITLFIFGENLQQMVGALAEARRRSDASAVLVAGQGSQLVTAVAGLSLAAGCNCESDFTDGTCEDLTGRCYCKPNYTGEHCDACAEGYLNFPHCYREWGARGRGGPGLGPRRPGKG